MESHLQTPRPALPLLPGLVGWTEVKPSLLLLPVARPPGGHQWKQPVCSSASAHAAEPAREPQAAVFGGAALWAGWRSLLSGCPPHRRLRPGRARDGPRAGVPAACPCPRKRGEQGLRPRTLTSDTRFSAPLAPGAAPPSVSSGSFLSHVGTRQASGQTHRPPPFRQHLPWPYRPSSPRSPSGRLLLHTYRSRPLEGKTRNAERSRSQTCHPVTTAAVCGGGPSRLHSLCPPAGSSSPAHTRPEPAQPPGLPRGENAGVAGEGGRTPVHKRPQPKS